jgi:hypothetical protein
MSKFKDLKVGDKVWTMQTGYSLVTSVSDTINYPILVDGWASYTTDGKWGCRDKYDSLYFENPLKDEFKTIKKGEELNSLFKTLKHKIYANRTNDGTPEGCEQAMDDSIRIEQIADDFAIGFAEWLIKYPDKGRNFHGEIIHAKGRVGETYLTKELLEIYKKEKGL